LLNRTAVGGIIGKVSFDPREPLALPNLEQMLGTAVDPHDPARRLFTAPGIALGSSGARAAGDRGDRCHVVADAQITNAADLRRQLAAAGHAVRGTTTSELILRCYEAWGTRAFARLRGAFACAIWDDATRRLVLARDHVGLRPLHFALLPNHGVLFASEVRALLRDPGVGREWHPAAIDAYLALGYVPAPLTPYYRVSKLESAHFLVIEGRRLHVERYWDLPQPSIGDAKLDEREIAAAIGNRLRHAVADHSADGVVNGLLYSGGTPSTTLLAASAGARGMVITVAIDQDASELARSGRAASMLGRAREIVSSAPDAAGLARTLAAHCDEPVADPAALMQFALCTAARAHADSVLTAHGAATLWAGHTRHRVERLESMVCVWLGRPLATLGAGIARPLQDSMKGARALSRLALPPADAYAVKHTHGFWDDNHRRTLYTRRFAWEVRESNPYARHLELYASRDTADPLDRAVYVDAHTFLPDSVLAVAERAATAAGLTARMPFLDLNLVESAVMVPSAMKQRGPAGMYALRTVLARDLPGSLLPPARRLPARHAWLGPALAALVPSILLGPRFDGRDVVSRPALRQLWTEHESGRRDHAHRLWALLMLEFWFRDAIDGDVADVPAEYAVRTKAA
jgi:asparagine synthase (glutamine-hydrolysing)